MPAEVHSEHEWTYLADDEAATRRFGEALGTCAQPGDVVALMGELGAGKTRIAQAVAAALGIDPETVTSPTFVLIHEHDGRLPVYHFDAYRLRDTDEFLEIGAEELLDGDGLCLVEWADRVDEVLPRERLEVRIEITGEHSRLMRVTGTGMRGEAFSRRVREELLE
jgi:tRNA threonylcarbamoyladenosine biosynthesis protein TsaE